MAGSSVSLPAVKIQEGKRSCNTWIFVQRACTEINLIEENSDVWFLLRGNWLS